MPKKLILLALFIIFYTITHAQYASWMRGTWKSTSGATTPSGSVSSTIQINDVSRESFTGTKTSEINDGSHAKITISISGAFRGRGFYLQDGAVVNKEGPESRQWHDCSACSQENKIIIGHDSLILISSISGCDNGCDGETRYYRLLSEYDNPAQRYLVDRFGRPSDIIGFHPYQPKEGETVQSIDDSEPPKNSVVAVTMVDDAAAEAIKNAEKRRQDSLDNIARIKQQHINDSARLAQQKKREQEITDSLNLVQQKQQQRTRDSLDNVARIKQEQLVAATLLAQQKKREQEIADSLNLAQQKEQQHTRDSLDNVARIKQEQLAAATLLAQQKKREQEIADSLNLVQQKQQQRIKDSLDNVARLEQIRLRTEDSLRDVQAKNRQQEITDSLNLVQQKEQLRLKDSLNNVARLEQIRLRTEDSLRDVQAKKRQQQIADSINLVQQKEQQRIKDSLDNVARIRQQQINDSTLLAQQKKRQQEIADSLNLARQREQQRVKDSLNNVARLEQIRLRTEDSLRNVQIKKRQQEVADSLSLANQRKQQHIKDSLQSVTAANLQKQRTADSLRNVQARKKQQEADSLAAIRKQRYNDSLQKAALAKAVPPATPGNNQSATDKALTSRASVLLQTYHITSPDILIELFDNGEIDSDRVSVYHNNVIIVSNQLLGIKAITVNVHADATNREHEFVLVAENLGSIPPNSALMRVTAGRQSYKLSVNTDMKTNARIVFYYDGN